MSQVVGSTSTDAITLPAPRQDRVESRTVDEERLGVLLGQVVGDLGAVMAVPLVLLGDRVGLFENLAQGAATAPELAQRADLSERYVQEWLLAMAASGYIDHLGEGRYALSPEQYELFCNPDSPAYVAGGFQAMTAATRALDRLTAAFRTGDGIGWHEHHPDLFTGTERFFRPGYVNLLTSTWIPAVQGLQQRLEKGARVADVGCGLGASTRILAEAYPASTFVGSDYHEGSIETARAKAAEAGLGDRATFTVAGAQDLDGEYDAIMMFDCLHDMPDPLRALQAARRAVASDGCVVLVEPLSGDSIQDALNPVGRLYAAASVFICLPSGLSSEPRTGLGNQAGPARTLALAAEAGFTTAREATRAPFNIVYELRP
jgi:SAM-dependent methyltransferase